MLFTPIKPMLLEARQEAFDDERYIFEPKWDGWRILIHKEGERVEAYTRNGNRVTEKFPELQEVVGSIRAHSAVLDAEGVCIRDGRPIFDDFAHRGRQTNEAKIKAAARSHPATFAVFDVLQIGGRDLTGAKLTERKEQLQELIVPGPEITTTMFVDGAGKALFDVTCQQDMEGIVAKRKDSKYQLDTRSADWLKIKHWKWIDCVVLGYRLEPQFGLVLGLSFRTIKNKPVGVVEFGFKPEEKRAFLAVARQAHTKKEKGTQWIEPKLCCRIKYLERSDRHYLRHTVFEKFVFDKRAEECI